MTKEEAINILKTTRKAFQAADNQTSCLDTISRQAAIDAVLDRMDVEKHGRDAKPEEIQWTLEKLPSAQPYTEEQLQKMQDLEQAEIEKAYELGRKDAKAEIVRCKDCRWSDANEIGDLSECHHVRGLVNASPNGYCNFAERRTDD